MKKGTIQIAILLFLLSAITVGCRGGDIEADGSIEEKYVAVEVERVKVDTIGNEITLNGRILTNREVAVIPTVPGKVERIKVKLGDNVNKDSILFVIDQEDVRKAVRQAETALNAARINYNMTKEQIQTAINNYENMKLLYQEGAISKNQLEQAELAASTKPLEALEQQVIQAEIAYQQAMRQFNNTEVKAPIAGYVSSLNIKEGQMASNAQPAVSIANLDELYLELNVSENLINLLTLNQEVTVIIPSIDEEIVSTVSFIGVTVDPRTQLYPVRISLDNPDHYLKPGMVGRVRMNINERQNALIINSSAVITKDEKQIVYVVEEDRAVERAVTIGINANNYLEVIDGLYEGERIITKGNHYVEDGTRVRVVRGE